MESEEKLAFTPSYSWQNPIHACTRWTKYTKNRLAASKLHKNEQKCSCNRPAPSADGSHCAEIRCHLLDAATLV